MHILLRQMCGRKLRVGAGIPVSRSVWDSRHSGMEKAFPKVPATTRGQVEVQYESDNITHHEGNGCSCRGVLRKRTRPAIGWSITSRLREPLLVWNDFDVFQVTWLLVSKVAVSLLTADMSTFASSAIHSQDTYTKWYLFRVSGTFYCISLAFQKHNESQIQVPALLQSGEPQYSYILLASSPISQHHAQYRNEKRGYDLHLFHSKS